MSRQTGCSWRARLSGVALVALLPALSVMAEEGTAPQPEAAKKQRRWGAGWDEGLALRARFANGWGLGLRINPDLIDPERSREETSESSSDWQCYVRRSCRSESQSQSKENATGDTHTLEASLMVYREKALGKWLAVGPYLAFNYQRLREFTTEEYESDTTSRTIYPYVVPPPQGPTYKSTSKVTTRLWQRNLGLELGVRPVFQFHERFLLETRFGLELAFGKWSENVHTHSESENGAIGDPRVEYKDEVAMPSDTTSTVSTSQGTSDSTSRRKGSQRRLHAVGERLGPGASLRFIVLF